jgi:cell division protein FtsI/penicillin-binding protein 2
MRAGLVVIGAAIAVAASVPVLRKHDRALFDLLGKARVAVGLGSAAAEKPVDPTPLVGLDLTRIDDRGDVLTAPAQGLRNAELTLDADYQRYATALLRDGRVYEGAVVMTDVRAGRVLVWAGLGQGRVRDVVAEASAPSASVFKIATGAALVEAGVPLSRRHCYAGGEHGIERADLEPDPKRDRWCASLPMAMGRSLNTVFARLALAHLERDKLRAAAQRLGWGIEIPFDVPVQPSGIALPEDPLEYARTAAGFWNTTLSPFHGAMLAQTLANAGVMVRARVVERVLDDKGRTLYHRPAQREVLKRVLDERTAWAVARMMEQTVRNGTSFASFHDRAGRPFLGELRVAGKTGTLTKKGPGETLYTWWVGFAPADAPEVALSVLVVNRGKWYVKATHIACDMLRAYFADQGAPEVRHPSGYAGKKRRRRHEATGGGEAAPAAKPVPALPPEPVDVGEGMRPTGPRPEGGSAERRDADGEGIES